LSLITPCFHRGGVGVKVCKFGDVLLSYGEGFFGHSPKAEAAGSAPLHRLRLSLYSRLPYPKPGGLLDPQLKTLLAVVTSNSLVIGFLYPPYEMALTPGSKTLLETTVVSQLFKEFAEFYGNRSFITIFKRDHVEP
jgi:hypothetical protein